MREWNFNIDEAPKGSYEEYTVKTKTGEMRLQRYLAPRIIAAGSGDTVTVSTWIPGSGRWDFFSKDCPPVAWMPFPEHPNHD